MKLYKIKLKKVLNYEVRFLEKKKYYSKPNNLFEFYQFNQIERNVTFAILDKIVSDNTNTINIMRI